VPTRFKHICLDAFWHGAVAAGGLLSSPAHPSPCPPPPNPLVPADRPVPACPRLSSG
jgi:hypothetical protein